MSRELRAKLEGLQQGIKAAQATLAEPEPPEFLAELDAQTAAAAQAESQAGLAEQQAQKAKLELVGLRDEVARAEQRVLAEKAQSAVPLVSILTTFCALGAAFYAWLTVWNLPHTPGLELAVKGVASGVLLPAAWLVKRRLMVPPPSNARLKG